MTAFRLETLVPGSTEASTRATDERRLDEIREEAYRRGYLDGQAAATDAYLDDQHRLSSELVEALADARLTNEAARRHVAASLAPLIAALTIGIAPTLADAGIDREILRLIERALARTRNPRPRLRCAPEVAARIRAVLAERGLDATVEEAPELLPREALVFWDQGYDHLDLDACVKQVCACITSHLGSNTASEDDDARQS